MYNPYLVNILQSPLPPPPPLVPPPPPPHPRSYPTAAFSCNRCRISHFGCDIDVENLHGCTRCRESNYECVWVNQVIPTRPDNVPSRSKQTRNRTVPVCDRCDTSYNQACDMDPEAGIGCRVCCVTRGGPYPCIHRGRELQRRPLQGAPILDTVRHSCDSCIALRLKTCNWLDDTRSRAQPCLNCSTRNRLCRRNWQAPHVANTQVPYATPANTRDPHAAPAPAAPLFAPAASPAGYGLPTPAPTRHTTPGYLNVGLQPPPGPIPLYPTPGLTFGQLGGGAAPPPASDNFDDLMQMVQDGSMNSFLQALNPGGGDFDLNLPVDEGQNQMDIDDPPEELPNWEAQAPKIITDQARQIHAFMQRRSKKLMKQIDRHVDPQLLAMGADPRLGHDPFAPPPAPDNEDLQHQFPPGLDWTATRYGSFKRHAAIQAPLGSSTIPFEPGPYNRLWKGLNNPANPFPSNVAALASVPTKGGDHGSYRNDLVGRACEERIPLPGENSRTCGLRVAAPVTHCLDRNHAPTAPRTVCWSCNDKSKSIILASDSEQLRAEEVLASRAYACARCLASGAAERLNFAFCGSNVWGYREEPDELTAEAVDDNNVTRGGFMGPPTPVWGCSCTKLLSTLCQEHRLLLAEAWLTQVDLMNEWILSVFGRKVCPVCHIDHQLGVDAHKFEGELGGEKNDKVMWACVSCQEFVVVPRQQGQGLIPGIEDLVIDVNSYFKKSSEIYTGGFTSSGQRLAPLV